MCVVPRVGLEPTRVIHSRDFKSLVYTNSTTAALEAWVGIAPTYIGFADQCLSYLATRPFYLIIIPVLALFSTLRPNCHQLENRLRRDALPRPKLWLFERHFFLHWALTLSCL
jgi:hypothetical protein